MKDSHLRHEQRDVTKPRCQAPGTAVDLIRILLLRREYYKYGDEPGTGGRSCKQEVPKPKEPRSGNQSALAESL
ncbi:hypothetical protein KOW79_021179 [Hemibagrus wyckioides]|uniref:Uncharacterized protein n=1 Tax=Hemibagrus wyckioides TaxID=337641 RepID=A0A9D3N324_9TELE|nr:hypothetical protein KOW79_021179 [Hemibagrus wyckioides]